MMRYGPLRAVGLLMLAGGVAACAGKTATDGVIDQPTASIPDGAEARVSAHGVGRAWPPLGYRYLSISEEWSSAFADHPVLKGCSRNSPVSEFRSDLLRLKVTSTAHASLVSDSTDGTDLDGDVASLGTLLEMMLAEGTAGAPALAVDLCLVPRDQRISHSRYRWRLREIPLSFAFRALDEESGQLRREDWHRLLGTVAHEAVHAYRDAGELPEFENLVHEEMVAHTAGICLRAHLAGRQFTDVMPEQASVELGAAATASRRGEALAARLLGEELGSTTDIDLDRCAETITTAMEQSTYHRLRDIGT